MAIMHSSCIACRKLIQFAADAIQQCLFQRTSGTAFRVAELEAVVLRRWRTTGGRPWRAAAPRSKGFCNRPNRRLAGNPPGSSLASGQSQIQNQMLRRASWRSHCQIQRRMSPSATTLAAVASEEAAAWPTAPAWPTGAADAAAVHAAFARQSAMSPSGAACTIGPDLYGDFA